MLRKEINMPFKLFSGFVVPANSTRYSVNFAVKQDLYACQGEGYAQPEIV
jgi:hypothetical protein